MSTTPGPPAPESVERLSHRVFTSTAWNYVGHGATLLTWFLLTPFVVTELGVRGYGLFVIATAVMGYAQLFELGLTTAVTRFISELHERRRYEEARNVVVTAFLISVGLTGVTTLVGLALAPIAPKIFGVAPDLVGTTQQLMVVAGLAAGVSFTAGTMFGVLQGLQRFDLVNQLQMASTFLLAALTIIALVAELGVVWVVGMLIPTSVLTALPAVILIGRVEPELRMREGRFRRSEVRRLFSFSWAFMFMSGATLIKGRTDELIIAAALPVARVTPYSLARRTSEAANTLVEQFTRVIMPLAAQLGAREEHDRLRSVVLVGTRLTLAAYGGLGIAMIALAGPFLATWVSEEFRSAGIILVILAVAGGIELATRTADSVLQGISKHHPLALFAVLGAALNLGLSIALVGPMGIEGVAVGTLVATAVEALLLVGPYTMRTLSIGIGSVVREVLLPVGLPVIPAAAVAYGLSAATDPGSLPVVLLLGAVIVLVYVASYLAIGAAAVERELMMRLLGSATRRLRPTG